MSQFNKVLESVDLPDEFKEAIKEAWDGEVEKNRQEVMDEIEQKIKEGVEERTQSLVEAADALISSVMEKEIKELAEDRKEVINLAHQERAKAVKQRVQETREMKRTLDLLETLSTQVLDKEIRELHEDRKLQEQNLNTLIEQLQGTVDSVLKEEMSEFRQDRQVMQESMGKMENLVVKQLTRELSEFQQDRKALQEKSIRLEKESARKLEEAKNAFMERASKSISETVDKTLHSELVALREDIQIAKENRFGRKIFEAFAGEYLTSHLSEGTELHKLRKQISESEKNMRKMQQMIAEREEKLNKSKAALREARESGRRSEKLNELLRPLNRTQRETMGQLLENVATEKLEESFKRYVPAILENDSEQKRQKKMISESKSKQPKDKLKESTGERSVRGYRTVETPDAPSSELDEIIRLAGLNNVAKTNK